MPQQVTLGGDRLGSGKQQKVTLHGYERSNHNLGFNWKNTMSPGTLVPFLSVVALNGDNFKIELNADCLTHPTVGPLFGSFKVQLDVFTVPIRLYQAKLHNNQLGIGMNMSQIKLPQIEINVQTDTRPKNNQLSPSSLLSYLGMAGLGSTEAQAGAPQVRQRQFNAIPYLAYYDIFKNYYANKQEAKAYIIHREAEIKTTGVAANMLEGGTPVAMTITTTQPTAQAIIIISEELQIQIQIPTAGLPSAPDATDFIIGTKTGLTSGAPNKFQQMSDLFVLDNTSTGSGYETHTYKCIIPQPKDPNATIWISTDLQFKPDYSNQNREPVLQNFDLTDIDGMRNHLLTGAFFTTPIIIKDNDSGTPALYQYALKSSTVTGRTSSQNSLEGLCVKTYQSDLFNNWLLTDWITGPTGISAITAVATTGNQFTIDTLNLSMKVYYMLNRIAVSGGSYDDWQEAVYDHKTYRKTETPMYLGGLSKELVFQQVISNSTAVLPNGEQPLGTLAGRGVMSSKHKGGYIDITIDEPSYIIGIASLTPRICYSQGNSWDNGLKTMDDLHKPALDQIGFQDLTTEQLAAWSRPIPGTGNPSMWSAGKQPAWINYMTAIDQAKGNFAAGQNENFMVLDRNYIMNLGGGTAQTQDITTYIDPAKFNNTFASTRRDAMNFWMEIQCDITARRKMSAKVMPNL